MPDAPNPTPPEPETPSSPTLPSGTPTAEYRYPNDPTLPDWARGKSATEILQLTQQLVEDRVRGQQAPPPAPSAPAPAAGDDDYVTGRDLRAMRQSAAQEFGTTLEGIANQNAQTAYNIVKRDHKDTFSKYEPEIVQVLGRVPRNQWTLDVVENAVKFVRGNHVDEIAEEKARHLAAQMEPTIRSTGSGGSAPVPRSPDHSLESDKLPDAWKAHAKAAGIGERELQELCWAQGLSPEEFFAQFDKGLVTDAIHDVRVR